MRIDYDIFNFFFYWIFRVIFIGLKKCICRLERLIKVKVLGKKVERKYIFLFDFGFKRRIIR